MPNNYFRFKQFTIQQEQCAMKVGTDGVLLGAWADITDCTRVLDIGTGTGLIALMLAQRSEPTTHIEAIEVDTAAAQQAQENVTQSPWSERVAVYQGEIQQYQPVVRYDLLVSNPPYFERSLKASHQARTTARHADSLTQHDLLQATQRLLSPHGRLAVIYPTKTAETFLEQAAAFGLTCRRKLWVKPKPHLPPKRLLLELTPIANSVTLTEQTLTLEHTARHDYTAEFMALTKTFYLKF
ncbi:methyltransferase [Anaerolineales bacterium HSG25]|nr:methyltransferase [Anaerolineales bacterium HSG25]